MPQQFGNRCWYTSASSSVLGGSSVTSDAKYARGVPQDYAGWPRDWAHDRLLPYFKVSEDNGDYDMWKDTRYHSRGGELHVQRFKYIDKYMESVIEAFEEVGFVQKDINAGDAFDAVVHHQFAILNNTRLSANTAFLKPVRHMKNLQIITGATVTKILVDKTTKAVDGVLYERGKSKEQAAYVKREVVLAAGAINNAKLLLLSGIGPRAEVSRHNITLLQDSPVGLNYRDQVSFGGLSFMLEDVTSFNESQLVADFEQWFESRTGLLASRGIGQISSFVKSREDHDGPDIEYVLDGNFVRTNRFVMSKINVAATEEQNLPLPYYNIINVKPVLLKPKSKGRVTLNKQNPKYGRPTIQPNFLKENKDLQYLVDSVELVLQLLNTESFKKTGIKLAPIDHFPCEKANDREKWSCMARHYTTAMGTPVGTCRMGTNATEAVVDPTLKVYGVEGLRVVDASVMPAHVSAGIFAVSVMIAEKGAKMLIDDWKQIKDYYVYSS
ncbi:Glucose dehydrogenase [Eumeta japonica]|uniref:Glucose dehydrogenase n=1 Tax=Eumeta variegata TaxID=151549 RepID=A0A4C1UHH2_EUMVA|nr:Glucose dehydrogenase [Eumeta japonica]